MTIRLIALISLLLGTLFTSSNQPSDWKNPRGNAQLQGATNVEFPKKIKKIWSYDAEGIFKSAPVVADGKIIVGSTNGDMLCLSLDGKLLWKFVSGNSIEAPAIIQNGIVYFGNLSGALFALDLKTGKKKWEYKTGNQIMGAPAYIEFGNQKIIAVGSYDFMLHGVNATTGKMLWTYESDNYLNSSPAVANGKAVFGGCDGFVHIVDLKTGKPESKVEVATYVASSPAIIENRAYVGDYSGGITCIDLSQKKILWKYENKESDLPFLASPSVIDKNLIIGSRDKFIYCFDLKNGKIIWKKNTGNRIEASTVVNKKQVLLVNMRGDLMLIDISDGKTVWTYELGTSVVNTPAVVEEGIVVAGSDGNVYFFNDK